MSVPTHDWRIVLICKYRSLFQPPSKAPVLAKGYPECGSGWSDVLERACDRIAEALRATEWIVFLKISSKNGSLRIYWSGELSDFSRYRVQNAVALAEARSAVTCELCGARGQIHRSVGALITRCSEHAEGVLVPVKPRYMNVHIVHHRPIKGPSTVTCRRYDRDTDAFVDIGPSPIEFDALK